MMKRAEIRTTKEKLQRCVLSLTMTIFLTMIAVLLIEDQIISLRNAVAVVQSETEIVNIKVRAVLVGVLAACLAFLAVNTIVIGVKVTAKLYNAQKKEKWLM